MSRKIKRGLSSTTFTISKLYQNITTAKPSTFILALVVLGIAIFLYGGGLYNIIMTPYPAVYYQNRFLLVYPGLSEQFIADSLISMILYAMGAAGLIIMYQSTKYAYKPRQAYMMLMGGIVLLLLAYIFIEAVVYYKTH
ncbi:MAG: hypothetical protein QW840_03990 [Candidatus Bathyarchaeia archaeon]